ncbi:3-isopropylmalate dehydratase small subunit [Streptomyces sp. SID12501]|uniref:3-isopropylmalate dehydratase small subunit n=1 Tax=Streptomyces sp. SID12501 TaxID=2706042 RepID=A0A6B3BMG2_9ACTN|nr:3-isopropylmalate dehydratase small subunit [Streptomyces sp. SID12501]NEC85066.1 3-isopropylmalate dehydratase small subunit [Streptomyces sp. SID12501]
MEAFTTHTGTAAPLRHSDVDTDQIIPAEYLKRITRTGFEDGLFVDWRRSDPDFVLNQPRYATASILVAGPDFGIGSSREHAVWALLDGGFRVVVSARFGDIFRTNCTKAGLLAVVLPQREVEALWEATEADPTLPVTVDLTEREVRYGDRALPFQMEDYTRWRLLNGLDDIGLTERHRADIDAYEARRSAWLPTALPVGPR